MLIFCHESNWKTVLASLLSHVGLVVIGAWGIFGTLISIANAFGTNTVNRKHCIIGIGTVNSQLYRMQQQ